MKSVKFLMWFTALFFIVSLAKAQNAADCGVPATTIIKKSSQIGIVISSNDPETVWNAFRLANYSVKEGDSVSVFLLAKGVEAPNLASPQYDVKEMMEQFSNTGGKILACGTCLKSRNTEGTNLCPVSTLADLYALIKASEIVLTF